MKLSTYFYGTHGFQELINYFGDTDLQFINDYNSDIVYAVDLNNLNCTMFSMDPNETDSWPGRNDFNVKKKL